MAGSRHLARFRKELPYRPERLETLLSPLLEGARPDGLAHTWVRADRLTVLPRLCEALGADLHSWCEVGLAAADLAVADMLDLALSLELGTLVIYDPSPQRANAVHVPLGADPVFQGTRRGLPWRGERHAPWVARYEEGYGPGRPPSTMDGVARRRRAAIWARDRFLAGHCPSPEAVRARGQAGREERGGASAAVAVPVGGTADLLPLLEAWLALVEAPTRLDLMWAAPHQELCAQLSRHRVRRTVDGRRWFGVCSLPGHSEAPRQGDIRRLLSNLSREPLTSEMLAGAFLLDDLLWPSVRVGGRPGQGALALGFDADRNEAWIQVDVVVDETTASDPEGLSRSIWQLLPGAGACAITRL